MGHNECPSTMTGMSTYKKLFSFLLLLLFLFFIFTEVQPLGPRTHGGMFMECKEKHGNN